MGFGIYQEELAVAVKDKKTFRLNITEVIQDVVTRSNFQKGIVVIHTLHTTTGLTKSQNRKKREPIGFLVPEDEPLLMEDLKFALDFGARKFLDTFLPLLTKERPRILDALSPEMVELALESAISLIKPIDGYKHDDFKIRTVNLGPNERKNAEAHLKAMMLRESMTWTLLNGRLNLGQWQSILFWDFDPIGRKRRKLNVILIGE